MKSLLFFLLLILGNHLSGFCQADSKAGDWPTWFISTGKKYSINKSSVNKNEIAEVLQRQALLDSSSLAQIQYWSAGSPGYRWVNWIYDLWMSSEAGETGPVSFLVLQVAIYDATVVAWKEKYRHNKDRPVQADKRVKRFGPIPESPSFPCETSVAAGVAVTVIKKYFPLLADSALRMAERAMLSRVDAGLAYPSDTKAGFDLGARIAVDELEYVKDFSPASKWDGKRPDGKQIWKGEPSFPTAGLSKTVILKSPDHFRPGPPPDFAKDMDELRAFKPGFRSTGNAFYFATESFWADILKQKLFEHNLHLDPPKAALIYAVTAIGMYDGFVSCWDAKYTYWGTRPDQYDPSFKPVLYFTPPFPGYPSGHAMLGSVMAEIMSYFFPADQLYFRQRAKDGAESRFQGGIHFRTDNEVGLELGRKVGSLIIERVKEKNL
ncbi:hypothetical protein [Flavihumibacter sp. UBA7668]|uniref:hypothetical protein n=1 Tax=Flavihumibacter sp. UBA7668 TaxID=1946542 RepID=UPI0025C37AFE|nr:hypothetical protein [Flavihumibacter sp. UBA7668]